jgi:hypothetical protein
MPQRTTEGSGTSAYASGGGGVTLEHTFGAVLLSSLLLGDPVVGLGDGVRVERVQLQAVGSSPVDDFVVFGQDSRISFGVRRDPTIAPSDEKFVKLLGNYARIAIEHAAEVDTDRWRLGLVVAAPHMGAHETGELSDFARKHPTNDSFRVEVTRNGATTVAIRQRLKHLDRAVVKAVTEAGLDVVAGDLGILTWRILRALHVFESRLEGDVAPDRTNAVARLTN